MPYFKTEKQKESFAKFLYDIAKIIFAIIVISPIAKPDEFNLFISLVGLLVAIMFFFVSQNLEKTKNYESTTFYLPYTISSCHCRRNFSFHR